MTVERQVQGIAEFICPQTQGPCSDHIDLHHSDNWSTLALINPNNVGTVSS